MVVNGVLVCQCDGKEGKREGGYDILLVTSIVRNVNTSVEEIW